MKRALLAIIMIAVLFSGCVQKKEESFVVKVGSEIVYEPEFRFYFLLSQIAYEAEAGSDIWLTTINGVKAEEVAKERAVESIARVKVTNLQAKSLGISLTEEEKQAANEIIGYYEGTLDSDDLAAIGISFEQIRKIIEETLIYGKVFEEVTENVEISEKDYNIYFESYINDPSNGVDGESALYLNLRPEYTQKVKSDFFEEQYSKWEAAVQIEKNNELLSEIHILEH